MVNQVVTNEKTFRDLGSGFIVEWECLCRGRNLPEGTTVNSLIKAGYKLFSTESAALRKSNTLLNILY
jgi:hypothetical protein